MVMNGKPKRMDIQSLKLKTVKGGGFLFFVGYFSVFN